MNRSESLFERAQRVIPGGVNSPVRAFRAVGGEPVFVASGKGCRIEDVDGKVYIDYVGSWGPLIDGHRSPPVVNALKHVAGTIDHAHKSGTAVLLITHYQRILRFLKPDHVHIMIDGSIKRSGGPKIASSIERSGYKKALT